MISALSTRFFTRNHQRVTLLMVAALAMCCQPFWGTVSESCCCQDSNSSASMLMESTGSDHGCCSDGQSKEETRSCCVSPIEPSKSECCSVQSASTQTNRSDAQLTNSDTCGCSDCGCSQNDQPEPAYPVLPVQESHELVASTPGLVAPAYKLDALGRYSTRPTFLGNSELGARSSQQQCAILSRFLC